MRTHKREITKEQYDNAMDNQRFITEEDMTKIFSDSERLGYGVYLPQVKEENGRYYVWFELGDSCD